MSSGGAVLAQIRSALARIHRAPRLQPRHLLRVTVVLLLVLLILLGLPLLTAALSALTAHAESADSLGSRTDANGSAPATRLRLETIGSATALASADRPAVFEEYVTAVRAALRDGRFERGRDLAEHAAEVFPELRRPWLHLAAAHLRLQEWGPAIDAARKGDAAHDDPYAPPVTEVESHAGAAYWEGTALYETQRYPEALPHLRAACERAPKWAEAARELGEACFVAGKSKECTQAYAAAFAVDPHIGSAQDLSYYAEALGKGGNLEGGVAAMQEALRRAPWAPGLHAKLGDLLRRENDITESYYQFFLELLVQGPEGPFGPPALKASNELILAARAAPPSDTRHELLDVSDSVAALSENKFANAIRALVHVLQLTHTSTGVPHVLLADAYLRQGNIVKSLGMLEDLLSRDPDFVPALFSASDLYTKMGKKQDAERALSRARTLYPDYWRLHVQASSGG